MINESDYRFKIAVTLSSRRCHSLLALRLSICLSISALQSLLFYDARKIRVVGFISLALVIFDKEREREEKVLWLCFDVCFCAVLFSVTKSSTTRALLVVISFNMSSMSARELSTLHHITKQFLIFDDIFIRSTHMCIY